MPRCSGPLSARRVAKSQVWRGLPHRLPSAAGFPIAAGPEGSRGVPASSAEADWAFTCQPPGPG